MSEAQPAGDWSVEPVLDDLWDDGIGTDHQSLVELVNRLLDKGVVISGDITISVAGIDLVYLGLSVVLSSVETIRGAGAEI